MTPISHPSQSRDVQANGNHHGSRADTRDQLVTPGELLRAITKARKSNTQALWQTLLDTLNTTPRALIEALRLHEGVACIEPSDWPQVQWLRGIHDASSHSSDIPEGIELSLHGQRILLCEDPWSAPSARLQMQLGNCNLALPLPGQREQALQELLQRAPQDKLQQPTAQTQLPSHRRAESTKDLKSSISGDVRSESEVVRFVEDALIKAYDEGASDVHFESSRQGVGLKFRLDGVMAAGSLLTGVEHAEQVISRIKVMSQLDITERRRPQDGRIHWRHPNGAVIDLRVSIMPSIHGEDAVLRLLDKAQLRDSDDAMHLGSLGFEGKLADRLRRLSQRPHGMLLITGPTGSGKTTTVYAALSEVNDGLEKIITIEDPVEYELPGVLQIPVNEQKGLTFATGLRSILRHDPDKILVGEIRDAETAQIAVQSALTGHLVFTTVHANSLFDVLGRFRHFGIEPFAMASALNGIVVQRLLRRACSYCMHWQPPSEAHSRQLALHGLAIPAQVPHCSGCESCRGTGYSGRFVVAEVHELTDALRDLMLQQATLTELKAALYREGDQSLLQQAVYQAASGHTTLEEIQRVIGLV